MKKIISLLMLAVCLAVAVPAQAQLKFGVKGGLNLSKLDVSYSDLSGVSDNTTGFFIGPMAEFTLPVVGLGVDGALMYSQRGKDAYKEQGVEIPLNLKYTIGLGSTLGVYVAAGPDFFFNFKDVDLTGVDKKDAQVGLNLGAGVKLLGHLQAGFTYQIPLGNSFELANLSDAGAKTKTWQILVAYTF